MPIMNGFESAQNIRKLIEKNKFIDVDIIGYTCYEGDKEKCKLSGMNLFLAKPASESIFREYLSNIC